MSQAARMSSRGSSAQSPIASDAATQEHGAIVRTVGTTHVVRTPSGEVEAKRARSCLVEPLVGDWVLVSSANDGAYVLAVLEREEGAGTTLSIEGDLCIAPTGRLSMRSDAGVDIDSSRAVRLTTKALDVQASTASLVVSRLSVLGAKLEAEIADIRTIGETLGSVFQRVSQTMKRSFRKVEETDHVDVRDAVWNVKETLNVHAGNAIVTSEELVKLDGNQIHLG